MKFNKIFTMALSLLVATAAFADEADKPTPEDKAKKDYSSWLPAQGDMSVGFALDPLATFAGNLFNGNLDNTLGNLAGEPLLSLPTPCVSIMGTYMLTNQLALRANIGFGYSLKQDNFFVQDDAALALNDLSNAKVTDRIHSQLLSGSFSAGIEYRLGKRLPIQGVFGVGLSYACGMASATYAYGNAITELNQNPSMNSNMPATETVTPYLPNARLLSVQSSVKNLMQEMAITCPDKELNAAHFSLSKGYISDVVTAEISAPEFDFDGRDYHDIMRELECRMLKAAIKKHSGNMAAAARMLGMDRSTIFRKIKDLEKHGMKVR